MLGVFGHDGFHHAEVLVTVTALMPSESPVRRLFPINHTKPTRPDLKHRSQGHCVAVRQCQYHVRPADQFGVLVDHVRGRGAEHEEEVQHSTDGAVGEGRRAEIDVHAVAVKQEHAVRL